MVTTVVYLDKLFLGNLIADFIILWAAGRLSQIRIKTYRVIAGACLGSFYSLALFLPGTDRLLFFYVKFAVSLAMVLTAYAPLPPRRLVICLSFFYLVSFVSGGAVIGASYFLSQTGGIGQINNSLVIINRYFWPGVTLAALVVWAGVVALPRYFKRKQGLESLRLAVTIFFNGQEVTVRGLIDTGNSLSDPVSGEPVLVVEHSALMEVLPAAMKEKDVCTGDAILLIERMMDTPWAGRLRLIPFQSLGNDRGLLLGIKPDRVEFVWKGQVRKVEKVVIGVHGRRLDIGGEYNAIINPSLIEWAKHSGCP